MSIAPHDVLAEQAIMSLEDVATNCIYHLQLNIISLLILSEKSRQGNGNATTFKGYLGGAGGLVLLRILNSVLIILQRVGNHAVSATDEALRLSTERALLPRQNIENYITHLQYALISLQVIRIKRLIEGTVLPLVGKEQDAIDQFEKSARSTISRLKRHGIKGMLDSDYDLDDDEDAEEDILYTDSVLQTK